MLNKAMAHHKEKREPYRGAKSYSRGCCNHRGCKRCCDGRQFFDRRRRTAADYDLKNWEG